MFPHFYFYLFIFCLECNISRICGNKAEKHPIMFLLNRVDVKTETKVILMINYNLPITVLKIILKTCFYKPQYGVWTWTVVALQPFDILMGVNI